MRRHKINWKVPKGAELTELDKKVLYYQDRGHLVPTRQLIKTPEQIEGIRRSGVINTGVLDLVEKEIHAGMSTAEIDKLVYEYTKDHGAIPACLGYEGFPKSCCTSINEVVCHGIPNEEEILEEGDIINVDCTTILDGYYADASRMFIIGKTTPQKEKLVRVAKECLEIGMEAAKPFSFVGDIGHAIEKHAKKTVFSGTRLVWPRGGTGVPRGTGCGALRKEGYGHAARAGHGVHHRADDQHGNLGSVYR